MTCRTNAPSPATGRAERGTTYRDVARQRGREAGVAWRNTRAAPTRALRLDDSLDHPITGDELRRVVEPEWDGRWQDDFERRDWFGKGNVASIDDPGFFRGFAEGVFDDPAGAPADAEAIQWPAEPPSLAAQSVRRRDMWGPFAHSR
jgi:hypothetical protein